MIVNHIIHTPTNRILAREIKGDGVCIGVMSGDLQQGIYPAPHKITYPPGMSTIEDVKREIKVKGEQPYQRR